MSVQESLKNEIESVISVNRKDLDFSIFKEIIDTYGVLICRDAFPLTVLKEIRDEIYQQVFYRMKIGRDFRKDLADLKEFPKELKVKTLNFLLEGVSDMAEIDPENIFRSAVENCGIMPLVERYVDKGMIHWLRPYYYARTVDPLEEKFKLKLHQDGTFLRALGVPPEHFFNCWAPLVTIAGNTPGLELVAKRFHSIFETGKTADGYHGIVMQSEEEFLREYKEYVVTPKVQMGDFIIFTPFTPHRTHLTENMRDIRTSVDFRFYCGELK